MGLHWDCMFNLDQLGSAGSSNSRIGLYCCTEWPSRQGWKLSLQVFQKDFNPTRLTVSHLGQHSAFDQRQASPVCQTSQRLCGENQGHPAFLYMSSLLGLLDATCIEMLNVAPGGGSKCPTGSDEEDQEFEV